MSVELLLLPPVEIAVEALKLPNSAHTPIQMAVFDDVSFFSGAV